MEFVTIDRHEMYLEADNLARNCVDTMTVDPAALRMILQALHDAEEKIAYLESLLLRKVT